MEVQRKSLKHPGRWLWLVLAIPIAIGLTRLKFDVDVFGLLPSDIPAVKGLVLHQEHFANARELILTLKGPDADVTEAMARGLAEELRQRTELVAGVSWEPPWLEHPDQAAELIAYLWLNQPPGAFQELAERLAPEKLAGVLAAAREELSSSLSPQEIGRLSYDPFGLTRLPESASEAAPSFTSGHEAFSSPEGTFRIVFVQSSKELRTYRECTDWLEQIRALAESARSKSGAPGVEIGFTGRPAFVSEASLSMERDMTVSVIGTAVIIAILFWLAHRRLKPLLWLLTLLALILGSTLALGGLIYGAINVVSTGFAAILLGLAVDYAVVHYQEALTHPDLTVPEIRHAIAPSIFWAALTTIAAFLVLNFGGLPGLGQLGTLVGVGVCLAATIMIFEFLPPLFPGRNETSKPVSRAGESTNADPPPKATTSSVPSKPATRPPRDKSGLVLGATLTVLVFVVVVLARGFPGLDPTANALRPKSSAAYDALAEVQAQLNQDREPFWVIISGTNVADAGKRIREVESGLRQAMTNGVIESFRSPAPLWPDARHQQANQATAGRLAARETAFRQAALTNGFAEAALGLTERILATWRLAANQPIPFWPTNDMSRWIFDKISARTPTNYLALGLVDLTTDASTKVAPLRELERVLPREGVWLSGWPLLGNAVLNRVQSNMWKVAGPMVALVLVSLLLAFRRPLEIVLSLGVLILSGFCLLTVMRLCGWSWNLLNLMAVPLILGTGVDYGIFMQLALRRHGGDLRMAYRSVGRALLLCGGTAIAGFGALAISNNAGMASLGQVCAVGIAANMLIAIFLLPTWWQTLQRKTSIAGEETGSTPFTPSSLYRSELWQVGHGLVRFLPESLCRLLGNLFGGLYWMLAAHRRQVVMQNLLPAAGKDAVKAKSAAKSLIRHFAQKVVDLWRFEAGLPIEHLFGPTSGWEHFVAAQAQKRGVLIVTPHLGNWEFGGPLLTSRGVTLQVITLAEPGQLTQLRQASRSRWNIETLVIGNDPLAFLEIIRRLEDGATVALLIDRPPAQTGVRVELFGQPFDASIAAAELARASGCTLLPVYIPRVGATYEAHILPPVPYERAKLRDRNARVQLTQRIVQVFEPLIKKHLDQWYHFVPVWPKPMP